MKSREVAIVSVGLHPWGVWPDKSQPEMAVEAISSALEKANMSWREIEVIASGSPLWVSQREGTNRSLSGTAIESLMGGAGVSCANYRYSYATHKGFNCCAAQAGIYTFSVSNP